MTAPNGTPNTKWSSLKTIYPSNTKWIHQVVHTRAHTPSQFHLMNDAFLAPDRPMCALKQFWESVINESCLLGYDKKLMGSKAVLESQVQGVSCLKGPRAPESLRCVTRMFRNFNTSQAWFPATRMYCSDKGPGGPTPTVCPLPHIHSGAGDFLRGMPTFYERFQLSASFVSRRNCFPQLEILLYSFMF